MNAPVPAPIRLLLCLAAVHVADLHACPYCRLVFEGLWFCAQHEETCPKRVEASP